MSGVQAFAVAVISAMVLSSCSTIQYYYQVYEVKSENVPLVNDRYVFDNDELTVRYDFCKRKGDVTFYCYNKTDRIIYLHLDNSFYIRNGIAYDYYKDCEFTVSESSTSGKSKTSSKTEGASVSASASLYGTINGYDASVSGSASGLAMKSSVASYFGSSTTGHALTTRYPKTVAIPPKSAKYIDGFAIQDEAIMQCGEEMYRENYPKKCSTIFSYTPENTPVSFSNHISYSFSSNGDDMKSFVNRFFVSSMQNKAESEVFERTSTFTFRDGFNDSKDACKPTGSHKFKVDNPTCFYNRFSK